MAVTEIQTTSSPTVTSPKVALYAVNGQQVVEQSTSEARSSGRLLTTQAPSLVPAKGSDSDYLQELVKLMNELLYAIVELNGTQSKLNNSQNEVSTNFVTLAKEQAKKAKEQYRKVVKAIEAAKHHSLFGKIFGAIAGGLMFIVGAITGDPALMAMGLIMTIMSASGAQEKLNEKIKDLSPALKSLVMVGMAVGSAVAIGAISGGVTALLTDAAEEGAADAAAEGTESAVSNGAESASNEAAENASVEENPSIAARIKAKKVGPFRVGNFVSNFAQSTLIFNPYTPAIQGILEAAGVDKKKAELIAAIAGVIVAIMAAIAGGKVSDTSLLNKSLTGTGKKIVGTLSNPGVLNNIVQGVAIGSNVTGGGFNIAAGYDHRDQADVIEALGKTKGALTVYQELLSWTGTLIQQSLQNFKSVSNDYAIINSRWADFVPQYAVQG